MLEAARCALIRSSAPWCGRQVGRVRAASVRPSSEAGLLAIGVGLASAEARFTSGDIKRSKPRRPQNGTDRDPLRFKAQAARSQPAAGLRRDVAFPTISGHFV